jgi:hypothetical protein
MKPKLIVSMNHPVSSSSESSSAQSRREFLGKCASCSAGLLLISATGPAALANITPVISEIKNVKRTFLKKGTCSQTMFFLHNQENGNNNEAEEKASDILAGGIAQQGYQCGLIWGAALAAGKEANKRFADKGVAIERSVNACIGIVKTFENKTKTVDCREITGIDYTKKGSILKGIFKAGDCFRLADKVANRLHDAASDGLANTDSETKEITSCTAETAFLMNATNEETVMVSGLAGGIGLSGNACGALATAIYLNAVHRIKQGDKVGFNNDAAQENY